MIQTNKSKTERSIQNALEIMLSLYPENAYWWSIWCLPHIPKWNFSYTPYYMRIIRSLDVHRVVSFLVWSISRISGNGIIDVSCKGYSDNRLADAISIISADTIFQIHKLASCGECVIMDTSCLSIDENVSIMKLICFRILKHSDHIEIPSVLSA